jgi:hypothetical protein
LELQAIARYDLELTESEFWELTPAQFDALNERHLVHAQMSDYRAGLIASILCNVNRKEGTKPLTPGDFFTSLPDATAREMTGEEMLLRAEMITQMLEARAGITK